MKEDNRVVTFVSAGVLLVCLSPVIGFMLGLSLRMFVWGLGG